MSKKVVYISGKRYVSVKETPAERLPEPEAMRLLTAPPRRVSPGVTARLVMGRMTMFGLGIVCFAMIHVCLFLGHTHSADRWGIWRDAGTATLVSSEKTDTTMNKAPVYRHVFAGEAFGGTCYSYESMEDRVGRTVDVERSVIRGMYRINGTTVGMFGRWFGYFFCLIYLFPIAGLLLVRACVRSALRRVWFLRNGEAAKGMVMRVKETPGSERKYPKLEIVYEYTAGDGRKHKAIYDSSDVEKAEAMIFRLPVTEKIEAMMDEPYKVIFYDPRNPERIFPLDALAGIVTVDERDGFFRLDGGARLSALALTAGNLLLAGIFIFELGIFHGWWTW